LGVLGELLGVRELEKRVVEGDRAEVVLVLRVMVGELRDSDAQSKLERLPFG